MKKLITVLVVIVGLGLVAKRLSGKFENIDWEKRFESMPDNAPPKWMFRNISEIHDNTQRILDLLEPGASRATRVAETMPPDIATPITS